MDIWISSPTLHSAPLIMSKEYTWSNSWFFPSYSWRLARRSSCIHFLSLFCIFRLIFFFFFFFLASPIKMTNACFLHITAQWELDPIPSVTNRYASLFVCICHLHPAQHHEVRWKFIGWEHMNLCLRKKKKQAVVGWMLTTAAGAFALWNRGRQYRWLGGDCMNNVSLQQPSQKCWLAVMES